MFDKGIGRCYHNNTMSDDSHNGSNGSSNSNGASNNPASNHYPESGQLISGQVISDANPFMGELEKLIPDSIVPGLTAEAELQAKKDENPNEYGWEPKRGLSSRHREIMRRLLEGASHIQIANEMGISARAVYVISWSQLFREELAKMEAAADFHVIKRAEQLSNEAVDTLKQIMRFAHKASDRRSAATDILGIAGYSKIEKKVVGVVDGEAVIRKLNEIRRQRIMGESSEGGSDEGITD